MKSWDWANDPPTYDTVWEDGEIAKDEAVPEQSEAESSPTQ